MADIGTSTRGNATKLLLLGSGELGKEVAIEAQRLGLYVIAVDRYENAPAMQVAHKSFVIDMLDKSALEDLIEREKPDYIVPEIEAIATDQLVKLEERGYNVVPNARATKLTMDREGIRRFAHEELLIKTSPYLFVDTKEEYFDAVQKLSLPVVIKPIMSSSGKGQSIVRSESELEKAWEYAQSGGRAGAGRIIVEKFIEFDYEITLLTVRHINGTSFVEPIGHRQEDGDYRESWQPQPMKKEVLKEAQDIAEKVTSGIGGYGVFGVELFIKGDEVFFSEVSPRPHDTGMVTLISQDLSEFALHVRAILGLPVPGIRFYGPSASAALLVEANSNEVTYSNLENALSEKDTSIRLFGKPSVEGRRRMGVALALDDSVEAAKEKACRVRDAIKVECK